jgi:hypothetical protein
MKKYYRFIELNPWKGTTHHYYIPTDSAAIKVLREFCPHQACFDLQDGYPMDEATVEHSIKFAAADKAAKVARVNLPRTRPLEPKDLREGKAFTLVTPSLTATPDQV